MPQTMHRYLHFFFLLFFSLELGFAQTAGTVVHAPEMEFFCHTAECVQSHSSTFNIQDSKGDLNHNSQCLVFCHQNPSYVQNANLHYGFTTLEGNQYESYRFSHTAPFIEGFDRPPMTINI
ncbi:MAG: hypothetical protein V4736_16320 [Bdellovibrionota bacterium]